jgi:hypothetical protein
MTDRDQKYVEFKCEYSNLALIESQIEESHIFRSGITSDDKINIDIANNFDKSQYQVELISQFLISADNKSFELSFLGFYYNGDTIQNTIKSNNSALESIYNNKHLIQQLPNSAKQAFNYYFKKYILSNINTDIFQIAQVINGEYNNKSIPEADQPIGIYKVSEISFNDQTRKNNAYS